MKKIDNFYAKIFLIIVLEIFFANCQEGEIKNCPAGCTCFKTTVKCTDLQWTSIPPMPSEVTVLDLRFNQISGIEPGTFRNLHNLHTLLLNNNNIQKLVANGFEGLNQLKHLYLYKNRIYEIDIEAFAGLKKLEQIYLHYNELAFLPKNTFKDLMYLDRLFLHNNKFSTLQDGLFDALPNLRRIRLDGNPLTCDCSLKWLGDLLKRSQLQVGAFCVSPAVMAGKSVTTIDQHISCSDVKPLELRVQPSDLEVELGSNAHFICSVDGNPRPVISWFFNGSKLENSANGKYSMPPSGELYIRNVDFSDLGHFHCIAKNNHDEIWSRQAYLRQLNTSSQSRPRILSKPLDVSVSEETNITFACTATGYPRPILRWTKNDLPLPADSRIQVTSAGALNIREVSLADQGVYRCTASNSHGAISEFARLNVFSAPTFLKKPDNQTVVEGHSVFFSCDAASDPPAKIKWFKDDRPLFGNNRISINPSATTLTIGSAQEEDEGIYKCLAESIGGERSAIASLKVVEPVPPSLSRVPVDVSSGPGSSVQFDCEVEAGDPVPTLRWQREGNPTALTQSHKYEMTDSGSLIIHEIVHSDEGSYDCIVENIAGTVYASVELTIRDSRFAALTPLRLNRTVSETTRRVNDAIDHTNVDLNQIRRNPNSPNDLLRLFRYPSTQALSLSRAAEVFEQTLERLYEEVNKGFEFNLNATKEVTYKELLTPSQLNIISTMSGCAQHRHVATCEDRCFHKRYRTFDGTCNNLEKPMLGSSLSPLRRLLPPRYENNFNTPIGWDEAKRYYGIRFPSARKVSLEIIKTDHVTPDDQFTHMLMQWGQFLDHDLDFVPTAVSNARFSDGRFCNESCSNQPPCYPIMFAPGDPRIRGNRKCIGFVRSSAMCGSGATSSFFEGPTHRQQLNLLTAYIDASNVYGSSEEDAFNLRDHNNDRGLMRVGVPSAEAPHKFNLPPNQGEFVDCQLDPNRAHVPCFQAGDHRVNEQLALIAMHTIWMREHNRLAAKLLKMNSHWNGDATYHETRKIIGATMQHITYTHWLPKVIGTYGMDMIGPYTGYNSSLEATISIEFSTAALRFGHTLINPVLSRLDEDLRPISEGHVKLHEAFFAPYKILEEGGIDPLLRGLFAVASKRLVPGEFLNSELTERLFNLANEVAQDLAAFNLQRGRDHGLRSYNDYRELCGMRRVSNFDDLRGEISSDAVREKLRSVYEHPDNIELFVGGIAEDTMEGARIGPTFICILADQFKRLRDGDRFWYENHDVFTPSQLAEIKKATLAKVVCDNGDRIEKIQPDVFLLIGSPDERVQCDSLPSLDLTAWSQCCQDCSRSGIFQHTRSRRSADDQSPESVTKNDSGNSRFAKANSEISSEFPDDVAKAKVSGLTPCEKIVETVEERVEELESNVQQLRALVKKLNNKIEVLEKKIEENH